MRNYGPVVTGAGNRTPFSGSFVPQIITIGDGLTAPDQRGLIVSAGGTSLITAEFANANILDTLFEMFASYFGSSNPAGGLPPFFIELSSGFLEGQSLSMSVVNNGAGTPEVRGFSVRPSGTGISIATSTIQASDNELFENFDLLILEAANLSKVNLRYANGHSEDDMDEPALIALLAKSGITIPSLVNAGTIVAIANDPRNPLISATVYSDGGGTVPILNAFQP